MIRNQSARSAFTRSSRSASRERAPPDAEFVDGEYRATHRYGLLADERRKQTRAK
ncbi:hypothetical protein GCM10028856_10640 [Halopiger thermotolerans]